MTPDTDFPPHLISHLTDRPPALRLSLAPHPSTSPLTGGTFPPVTDRTPPLGVPTNDPEQLPLGAFEGMPFLPDGDKGRGDEGDLTDADAAIAVREPPVCGEWS